MKINVWHRESLSTGVCGSHIVVGSDLNQLNELFMQPSQEPYGRDSVGIPVQWMKKFDV